MLQYIQLNKGENKGSELWHFSELEQSNALNFCSVHVFNGQDLYRPLVKMYKYKNNHSNQ